MAYPFPRRATSCHQPPSSYRDPHQREIKFDANESFPTDQPRYQKTQNFEQPVSTPNPSADTQYRHQCPRRPPLKRRSALVKDQIHREKSQSEREEKNSCRDGGLDRARLYKHDSTNIVTTSDYAALPEDSQKVHSKGANDDRNDSYLRVYPDTKRSAPKSAGVHVHPVDKFPPTFTEKVFHQPQRHVQRQEKAWDQPSLVKVTPSARRNLERFPKDLGPNRTPKQLNRTKSADSQASRLSRDSFGSTTSSVARRLSGVKTFWGRLFHRQKTGVHKSEDRLFNSLTDLSVIDVLEPRPPDRRAQERENQKRYLQTKKLRDQRLAEFKRYEDEQERGKVTHGQEEWNRNIRQVSQRNLAYVSSPQNEDAKSHMNKKGDHGKHHLPRRSSLDLISGNIIDFDPGSSDYEQRTNVRLNQTSRNKSSNIRNLKSRQPPPRPPPPPFHDIKGVAQGRFDNELCTRTPSRPRLLDAKPSHEAGDAKLQGLARQSWLRSGKDIIHGQISPLNCMFKGHGHTDNNGKHTAGSPSSEDSDWSFKCLGSGCISNSLPILDTNAVRTDRPIQTVPSTKSMEATIQDTYNHTNRSRDRAVGSINSSERGASMKLPDFIRSVTASSTNLEDISQHERHEETYRTLTSKDPRKDRYAFCGSLIDCLDSNCTPKVSSNDPQASTKIIPDNVSSSEYESTNLDPAEIPRPPSSVYTLDSTFNVDKTYTDAGNPFLDGVDLNKYQAFIANDKNASDIGECNPEDDLSMRHPNLKSQEPLLSLVKANTEYESGNEVLETWPPKGKPTVCCPTNSYWDLGKESLDERRTMTNYLPRLSDDADSVRDTAFYQFYDDVLADTTSRNRRTTDGLGYEENNMINTAKREASRSAGAR